jgi:transcriptional regulator of acetoin/glycerol metabolism
VSPELRAAPVELDDDALAVVRRRSDWLELAEQVLEPRLSLVHDSGHVLTLFDARGRMISSRGDPRVLEGLQRIHFEPGANWSEEVAGTNGPGTALASGRAVHIIGADHYCAAWHPWHCAAAPIRAPDESIVGAVDLSGAQDSAQPWALHFAHLLAGGVEQALGARAARWLRLLMARFEELAARYPTDLVAAVDHHGQLVSANPAARARGCPRRLVLREGRVERTADAPAWLTEARVHEIHEGAMCLGACVVAAEPRARGQRRAVTRPGSTRYAFEDLIGHAPALTRAIELARATAATMMPVLVLGESGVGKEVLAQSIHAASPRRGGPFVAVNCAALSRELVESELFGYVGGAFSGARPEGQLGRFEAADGGTLFLDEVGELPLPAQAALLRVLQEHEVTPVGENTPRRVDVRVIAATNRPLEDAIAQGRFRLDLFHRLAVVPVTLPPLRARPEDLPLLVATLVERLRTEAGLNLVLEPAVLDALRGHAWPGNVRELDNVLRRLAVVSAGRPATLDDLPEGLAARATTPHRCVEERVQRLVAVIDSAASMSEAAARLGITRSTLYRQLERLGLKPRRTVARGA